MVRTLMIGLLIGALFCLTAVAPARAQDAEAHFAQAQQTLTEIARLLDAIQARQVALAHGGNAASPNAFEAGGWNRLVDGTSFTRGKRTEFARGGKAQIEKNFPGGRSAIRGGAG